MRLAVKEGDVVQAGQPWATPAVSGHEVCELAWLVRSLRFVEALDAASKRWWLKSLARRWRSRCADLGVAGLGADEVGRGYCRGLRLMLRSGRRIADPEQAPVAILVAATETGPNCADPEVLLEAVARPRPRVRSSALAPTIHLTHGAAGMPKVLAGVTDVQKHGFSPAPIGRSGGADQLRLPTGESRSMVLPGGNVADMGALLRTGASQASRWRSSGTWRRRSMSRRSKAHRWRR